MAKARPGHFWHVELPDVCMFEGLTRRDAPVIIERKELLQQVERVGRRVREGAHPLLLLRAVLDTHLLSLWLFDIAPRVLPEADDPESIMHDALDLLCKQGEIFISGGIVFLDPTFATELLKPLVDHRLSRDTARKDVKVHINATIGATAPPSAASQLLAQVDLLCEQGRLSESLLPFLWRGTALRQTRD